MWERNQDGWKKEINWIPAALRWAAGEDHEYVQDILMLGTFGKIREERDLIPQRPYYFNLGCISTTHANKFRILQVILFTGQNDRFGPGEYCFEVTVTGEEIEPVVKYFKVSWQGGCTENLDEVQERFFVSMYDNPPI